MSVAHRGTRGTGSASLLALCFVVACAGGDARPATAPPPPVPVVPVPAPPPAPLDVSGWVHATDGTMPLVIIAPHGGDLAPAELPDRTCAGCETVNDANTQALAIAIADAFEARVGRRPFVVINRLSRRKFDANRDRTEATGGHSPLDPMWDLFHARVDSAKARATRIHPHALVIDLHGHAHAVPRLELGYLLTGSNLRLADSLLAPLMPQSSIARLDTASQSGARGAALVRGPLALGTRLATAGYPSVPSAQDPAPQSADAYFNGGYNTLRHGSRAAGTVDAVQLECYNAGVRDSPANRALFAEVLATALLGFLADHYHWVPA